LVQQQLLPIVVNISLGINIVVLVMGRERGKGGDQLQTGFVRAKVIERRGQRTSMSRIKISECLLPFLIEPWDV
jgi:hypothetical protein